MTQLFHFPSSLNKKTLISTLKKIHSFHRLYQLLSQWICIWFLSVKDKMNITIQSTCFPIVIFCTSITSSYLGSWEKMHLYKRVWKIHLPTCFSLRAVILAWSSWSCFFKSAFWLERKNICEKDIPFVNIE